ncbi:9566_t:CDS:2, partial [Entrophospora sp. SA101]
KKRSASDKDLTEERSHFFKKIQQFYPPPSELADTRKFKDYQDEKDPFILNYRPSSAAGLPVTLCSDILAKFQDDAKGIELNKFDIIFVCELSNKMCSFFPDENARRNCFHKLMSSYLNRVFDIYNFGNNQTTDGSIMFTKGNFQVPLLNLEVKPEIGMGNGCAYVQSTVYYVEFIKKFTNSPAISQSQFPVFLVYLVGPYMGVAGAVFMGKPVCEPLTPVMPLFYLPHHEKIILETAYVVKALKMALINLETFYDQLSQHSEIIRTHQPSFPCFNKANIGESIANITYVKRVENHYVFQAIMKYNNGSSQHIAGGWYVVIMEQLMEHNSLFYLAQDKEFLVSMLNKSIKKIHVLGFVHGDMRLSNILVGPDNSIKIIDFDWCGKIREVVYPPLLNQEIDVWHPDVNVGEKILLDHDLYMLNTELKKV